MASPAKNSKGRQRVARARANSADVALAAGVSASAVSRAFTPGASIAPAKRALIMKTAQELGYRPNVMARAISTRRSNVIGLLLFGETNRDHPEVLLALSASFSALGMRVMLFILERENEASDVIDDILSYQLDGVVAAAPLSIADLDTLAAAAVPVIFYNRPGTERCASVSCDHAGAGRMLVAHLAHTGHRRFALIRARNSWVSMERMRGVKEQVAATHGDIVEDYEGVFAYDDGLAAIDAWVADGKAGFDAVIAANDLMAIGASDGLARAGRLNASIAVGGFDGVGASRWLSHPIASIRQPIQLMAEALAEMMVKRIGSETAVVEYRLYPGILQPMSPAPPGPRKRDAHAS